jgi:glutathione S-transferase
MSLVFYYSPMSSATRIHWAIEELGIPYEKKRVDLAAGAQKSPEYLALNPNGKVPLIVDDGQAIFESLAILLHLADRYVKDGLLYPTPGPARSEVLKWMCWGSVSLVECAARILRNTSDRFPEAERNAAQAASARKEIVEMLGILEHALEGREYLVGDHFTYADLAIAAYMPFLGRLGVDTNAMKNINAWVGRCMTRPALARAMQG